MPPRLTCLVIFSVCLFGSAFGANTFFVAPTGSDNPPNDGSAALPFREIQRALVGINAGDTVLVADGQYKGFDVASLAGSAANPITIKAQGSNAVVNVTADRADNRDTIFVTFSSYIVIDGLQSSNANRSAMRIDQCQHITARNCVFGNNLTWGIFTDFSDDLLLDGNECFGSVQQHGIYVSNTCSNPIVRGNRLHDNFANGLHMNGDVSQGGAGVITNALVENNIIYGNGAGGGSGINCDGVQNSLFRNNLIYAAHGAGITLYQTDASAPSINATVINNTIDVASNGKWAIQIHNGSSGAVVFNNIFLTHHSFHGSIHLTVPADQQGLICDYNILTTNNNVATPDDDSTNLTFTQWKGLGFDTHSIQATQDACFVNWSGADYHLSATSPALDKGIGTLGGKTPPPTDKEEITRPQNSVYDMGAYEFSIGGGGGGTPPGVTLSSGPVANPNPAMVNQTVAFGAAATGGTGTLTYAWNFGDSTTGTGASVSHTYGAAGIFNAIVTVTDTATGSATGNISVTVNPLGTVGNCSGNATAIVGSGPDSDCDGFSDAFELAVGTDPNIGANTPTGTSITAADIQTLTISKASIKLNFAKANSDTISFSGTVAIPAGFNPGGAKTFFIAGGVIKTLTLTAKGRGLSGGDSIRVSLKLKKKIVQMNPVAKFSATFKKGQFAATLAGVGLTNANAKAAPVMVPFTFIFNNVVYQKTQAMSYTARKGKSGSAK